ncbi:MAG: DeoR family transcriptional regulator [Candidatus Pacebacteria bacterium]|nr:DeoR family transcriptional regulator [Candidatus Paceibacterota bacterium]
MNALNIETTRLNQKDIDKGQKIVAAIYLTTNHLAETEPIKRQLRSLALEFVCSLVFKQKEIISQIDILLGGATLAGLISEKNTSIIIYEIRKFSENLQLENTDSTAEKLFGSNETKAQYSQQSIKDIKRTDLIAYQKDKKTYPQEMSFTKNLSKKDSRQNKILSFINERKSAVIKDITSLFPEVSEKTVQRELNVLIDSGKITKRGSKRWSIYMAVNSLL